MSVVVAHQASAIGNAALRAAAEEAKHRDQQLAIVHVAEGLYPDLIEAHKERVKSDIAEELTAAKLADVNWTLTVRVGVDVAETVLDAIGEQDATLLVIGARRRSPVGKLFLGSVTQQLILNASVPVLVVKN